MDDHNDQPVVHENLLNVIEMFQLFEDLPPIGLCNHYLEMKEFRILYTMIRLSD
jgi:hypothetical protein